MGNSVGLKRVKNWLYERLAPMMCFRSVPHTQMVTESLLLPVLEDQDQKIKL